MGEDICPNVVSRVDRIPRAQGKGGAREGGASKKRPGCQICLPLARRRRRGAAHDREVESGGMVEAVRLSSSPSGGAGRMAGAGEASAAIVPAVGVVLGAGAMAFTVPPACAQGRGGSHLGQQAVRLCTRQQPPRLCTGQGSSYPACAHVARVHSSHPACAGQQPPRLCTGQGGVSLALTSSGGGDPT